MRLTRALILYTSYLRTDTGLDRPVYSKHLSSERFPRQQVRYLRDSKKIFHLHKISIILNVHISQHKFIKLFEIFLMEMAVSETSAGLTLH